MLLTITQILLGALAVALLFCMVFAVRLSVNQIKWFWMIYVILIAILGFHIEPGSELDLYRIFEDIEKIRDGYATIFDSPMLITNMLYWFVAHLNSNNWIVPLVVIIWGLFICGILTKYLTSHEYYIRPVMLYFLAVNGGCFIIYLLSGLRCSLAVAIWGFAYFRWYDNRKLLYYLSCVLCSLVHTIGIVLIGFTLFYSVLQKKKTMISYAITFIIILACGYILNTTEGVQFLSRMGTAYSDLFAEKLAAYILRGYEFQQPREMTLRALGSVFILSCIIYLHYKGNRKHEVFAFYILVMFAGYDMSILFERLPYMLGICSLPILNETYAIAKREGRMFVWTMGFIVFGAQVIWGVYEMISWLTFV